MNLDIATLFLVLYPKLQGDQSIHNGMVGYCGALSSEIVQTNGVKLCTDPEPPAPLPGDMHETPPPVEMEPTPSPSNDCLCVFDIDRTLTGKQGVRGHNSACPNNKKINFVWDAAYSGGWLHLSEVGQNLKKTFCKACYLGVVSAGTASGRRSAERKYLLKHVLKSRPFKQLRRKESEASKWSSNGEVKSPLVLKWPDPCHAALKTKLRVSGPVDTKSVEIDEHL